jgi:hypothetical protein
MSLFKPHLAHETRVFCELRFRLQALQLDVHGKMSKGSFYVYCDQFYCADIPIGGIVLPCGKSKWEVWRKWDPEWNNTTATRTFEDVPSAWAWLARQFYQAASGSKLLRFQRIDQEAA